MIHWRLILAVVIGIGLQFPIRYVLPATMREEWYVSVGSVLLAITLTYYIVWYWVVDRLETKSHEYRAMLDSIPQPVSVTDLDMRWTFVNKAATDPLGVTLEGVLGKHCSNWGAPICKTSKCGVECLRKGNPTSFFDQWGRHFRVDSSYLHDRRGKASGHIEVVNDISEQVALDRILGEVGNVSIGIDTMSSQVSSASQSLSNGATETASSLEEISSSMMQIASQATKNAENAHQVNQIVLNAKSAADTGSSQMSGMMAAIGEISASSQQISKIIKVIDDIAFQTNLLALNAAVEAARAGRHGKGFAVVAEEVRNLAARSAQAAQETTALIESSASKVTDGEKIAEQTAKALNEIVTSVAQATDLVGEIAIASREQAQGVTQVNQGIKQIEAVTQQNTASAEQTASSAQDLSAQAQALRNMLARFKQNPAEKNTEIQSSGDKHQQALMTQVTPQPQITLNDSALRHY